MEAARLATGDDLEVLADLARRATSELSEQRGGEVWRAREARTEPVADGFGRLLEDRDARVVVATFDGVPLGYAVARLEHLPDGSTMGVIDDIYVDPGGRGIGMGEAMMDDLVAWCTAQGCFGMDAMALPGDRETKNFFEGSGFTARKLVMYHSLRKG